MCLLAFFVVAFFVVPLTSSSQPVRHLIDTSATVATIAKRVHEIPAKSQFETTEEYRLRTQLAIDKMHFRVVVAQSATYNADKKLISIELNKQFAEERVIVTKEVVMGENGFGAKKPFLKETVNINRIVFDPDQNTWLKNVHQDTGSGKLSIFDDDLADVKRHLDRLRLVLYIEITSPECHQISNVDGATFDDPLEVDEYGYEVHARLRMVQMEDISTGDVWIKFAPEGYLYFGEKTLRPYGSE